MSISQKKSTAYKWISWFRSGRNEIEDEPRSGRPSKSVCEENMLFATSVADTINISVVSTHTVMVESLRVNKLSARWVPKLRRPVQQQTRVDLSTEMLNKWDQALEVFL